jgi:type IV secretion system protein VirB10
LLFGAVLWALQNKSTREHASEELYNIDHHNVADGLAGLPRDYAGIPRDVPRLGPPLPGDLGRPIVAAQTQSGPLAVDPEQQRMSQESEAARVSKVFASTSVLPPAAGSAREAPPDTGSSDDASAQNGQDRKLAFVNGLVDRRTTSPDRVTKPASRSVLPAGSVIPAALVTGIRSDLPGIAYAEILSRETGQAITDPTKLVAPMLTRFMATDRAFVKIRRTRQTPRAGAG